MWRLTQRHAARRCIAAGQRHFASGATAEGTAAARNMAVGKSNWRSIPRRGWHISRLGWGGEYVFESPQTRSEAMRRCFSPGGGNVIRFDLDELSARSNPNSDIYTESEPSLNWDKETFEHCVTTSGLTREGIVTVASLPLGQSEFHGAGVTWDDLEPMIEKGLKHFGIPSFDILVLTVPPAALCDAELLTAAAAKCEEFVAKSYCSGYAFAVNTLWRRGSEADVTAVSQQRLGHSVEDLITAANAAIGSDTSQAAVLSPKSNLLAFEFSNCLQSPEPLLSSVTEDGTSPLDVLRSQGIASFVTKPLDLQVKGFQFRAKEYMPSIMDVRKDSVVGLSAMDNLLFTMQIEGKYFHGLLPLLQETLTGTAKDQLPREQDLLTGHLLSSDISMLQFMFQYEYFKERQMIPAALRALKALTKLGQEAARDWCQSYHLVTTAMMKDLSEYFIRHQARRTQMLHDYLSVTYPEIGQEGDISQRLMYLSLHLPYDCYFTETASVFDYPVNRAIYGVTKGRLVTEEGKPAASFTPNPEALKMMEELRMSRQELMNRHEEENTANNGPDSNVGSGNGTASAAAEEEVGAIYQGVDTWTAKPLDARRVESAVNGDPWQDLLMMREERDQNLAALLEEVCKRDMIPQVEQ